jgi:hypothetical protein
MCGEKPKQNNYYSHNLEVDHIKPRAKVYEEVMEEFHKLSKKKQRNKLYQRRYHIKYLEESNKLENLRTLCIPCHKKVTKEFVSEHLSRPRPKRSMDNWEYQNLLDEYLKDRIPYEFCFGMNNEDLKNRYTKEELDRANLWDMASSRH